MKRYSQLLAGASWVAEYGNPAIPEEWAYLQNHSPYQLLRDGILAKEREGQKKKPKGDGDDGEEGDDQGKDKAEEKDEGCGCGWKCPKVLFTTSTRDDRVHPGHARKMVQVSVRKRKSTMGLRA